MASMEQEGGLDDCAQRKPKCGFPRCRNRSVTDQLFACSLASCEKQVHRACYLRVLAEAEVQESETELYLCSKRCYNKHKKVKEQRTGDTVHGKQRVLWSRDGSLEVLMNWLTTEGNYEKYTGGVGGTGRTKESYHAEIRRLIARSSNGTNRNEKDIATKIGTLEKGFRDATDWLNNTGAGLDDPGDIKAYILKRWPQYYELEPIMRDRHNTRPLFTNESTDVSSQLLQSPTIMKIHENVSNANSNVKSRGVDEENFVVQPSTLEKTPIAPMQSNPESESFGTQRRSISLVSPNSQTNTRRIRRRTGSQRATRGPLESSFDLGSVSELMMLRKEEVELRREEVGSKKQVDAAQTRKLDAEASYMEEKARRESQLSRFDLLKQKIELRDMGATEEEIEEAMKQK